MIFSDLEICLNSYYKPRLKLFKKLFGARVIDILLHMPSYVIKKEYIERISTRDVGKLVTTKVRIDCIDLNYNSSRPAIVYATNGDKNVEIVLFNYPKAYVKNVYPVGQEVGISGKLNISSSGVIQFKNPEKFFASKIEENSGLFNVYPTTTGLTQKAIYFAIRSALDILNESHIDEWLPKDVIEKNRFVSFSEALRNVHYPSDFYQSQLDNPYRRRLVFDELLAEQLMIRLSTQKTKTGYLIKNKKSLIAQLLEMLPFSLTKSQSDAIQDIVDDLESGKPMYRLLQGDVGSGKTVVAMIAVLYVIESGFQCAILVPTEILARQHYQNFKQYFDAIGISVELLTGSEKGKKRASLLENLAAGKLNLLIGTHAIITDQVNFNNLGLAVIDEQHRFGVKQRQQLINKGITPHVLSMTATPIPRTYVMMLYGDIAVSSITEKPAGRKEIITKAIPLSRISDVIKSIRRIIANKQKIYWVCPLIEENEKIRYTCVIKRFEFLKEYFGKEVELLHGKMKNAEKDLIFERFKYGDCNILVSTTVIEVGIDVPEATVIIIENSEKFGLATLHQLRGRVGRCSLQSYCLLLYDVDLTDVATQRIKTVCDSNDGFKIAEQDLYLRGGGEIFGTRQSGAKVYKTFDISLPENQDTLSHLLEQANSLAYRTEVSKIESNFFALLSIFNSL